MTLRKLLAIKSLVGQIVRSNCAVLRVHDTLALPAVTCLRLAGELEATFGLGVAKTESCNSLDVLIVDTLDGSFDTPRKTCVNCE